MSTHAKVLVKIFAYGFYKAHSGLILFLFATVMLYGLFITPLNETHLTQEEITYQNLLIVLTLISSPAMVVLVFVLWLFYTVKSWKYVLAQMNEATNQFLYYSSNAVSKLGQLKAWGMVQCIISLPMWGYAVFALVIGLFFGYYLIPVIILTYLLILTGLSAGVYVKQANKPIGHKGPTALVGLVRQWQKPLFSLFVYHVFDRFKIMLAVVKVLSVALVLGSYSLTPSIQNDFRFTGLVVLGLTVIHVALIYQSYRYESVYLTFILNFPMKRVKVYLTWVATYAVLTWPENVWLLWRFGLLVGLIAVVFHLSLAMLFRSILYAITPGMKRFVYRVFYLFVVFFLVIQAGMLWLLIPAVLIASLFLFYRNYYDQKPLVKP